MWETFSRPELEQAKKELRARRAAILRRHAEELQRLDAEGREIAELARLAAVFSRKFSHKPSQTEPRVRWIVAPAAAMPTSLGLSAPRPAVLLNRPLDRHQRRVETFSGTNFDMFLRAVTDSSF